MKNRHASNQHKLRNVNLTYLAGRALLGDKIKTGKRARRGTPGAFGSPCLLVKFHGH